MLESDEAGTSIPVLLTDKSGRREKEIEKETWLIEDVSEIWQSSSHYGRKPPTTRLLSESKEIVSEGKMKENRPKLVGVILVAIGIIAIAFYAQQEPNRNHFAR